MKKERGMVHDQLAKFGVAVTGASTGVAWLPQVDIYLKLYVTAVGALVGTATFVYYVLAGIEKWRALRKKK